MQREDAAKLTGRGRSTRALQQTLVSFCSEGQDELTAIWVTLPELKGVWGQQAWEVRGLSGVRCPSALTGTEQCLGPAIFRQESP